jgi:crotonobetainyl-CoA:carnitine CoA-transferase CaiB-like acyl-CoA transferase
MSTGVLGGIRVLDFGRYVAGPYCAALLGDLGAEVIRVEKVDGSEDRFVVPVAAGGEGAYFFQCNRNKLGLTLEPTKPAGREIVRRLVATADVVVANLPEQTLVEMGLDYASVRAIKPDVVLATASAFGTGGPYQHRVGFDGVGQAMSGVMYLTGPAGHPTKTYVPFVDYNTATLLAFGTLAALMARRTSGRGQHVDASLLATALTITNGVLIEQDQTQRNRVSSHNRSQISGPADAFRTRDGWIFMQTVGDPLFRRWATLMGEEHWLEDPRFTDDRARGDHGEILSARMAAWCAERTTEEALAALAAARIPAAPVYSPQQALDDPHVQAMGFLKPVPFPGLAKPAQVAETPVRLSETPGTIRERAPLLGEHTDRILAELGYDAAAIAALRAERVA